MAEKLTLEYKDTAQANIPCGQVKRDLLALLEVAGVKGEFYLCVFGTEESSPMLDRLNAPAEMWKVLAGKEDGYLFLFRRRDGRISGVKVWPKKANYTAKQLEAAVTAVKGVYTSDPAYAAIKKQERIEEAIPVLIARSKFLYALTWQLAEHETSITWKRGEALRICSQLIQQVAVDDASALQILFAEAMFQQYFQAIGSGGVYRISDGFWTDVSECMRMIDDAEVGVTLDMGQAVSTLIARIKAKQELEATTSEQAWIFADQWEKAGDRIRIRVEKIAAEVDRKRDELQASEALLAKLRSARSRAEKHSAGSLQQVEHADDELVIIESMFADKTAKKFLEGDL